MNIIEHQQNGLVYLTADFEAAGGVAHGFSTPARAVYRGIYATSTWA